MESRGTLAKRKIKKTGKGPKDLSRKTAREWAPVPWKDIDRVRTPRMFRENSQGEYPRIFKDTVAKWRDQDKRKEEKCEKRKKKEMEEVGEAQKKEGRMEVCS